MVHALWNGEFEVKEPGTEKLGSIRSNLFEKVSIQGTFLKVILNDFS